MEENTILSAEGEYEWPMEVYGMILKEILDTDEAVESALQDYKDVGDIETKLRLGGLELLRDVRHGK